MKQLLIIFSLAILFTACDKNDDGNYYNQTVKYSSVLNFVNSTNHTLNVDVYTNADDYKHSRNALMNFRLDKNKRYTDSIATMKKGYWLYLDIYSDDKTASNWGYWFKLGSVGMPNRDSLIEAGYYSTLYVYSDRQTGYSISSYYLDKINWRNTFLDGNKPETVWKAVGGSSWATLTNERKYLKLTLSKDMRCKYSRMQNGVVINTNAWYYLEGYKQGPEKFVIEESSNLQYLSVYNGDTLLLTTTYGDMYMVRE